MQEMIRVRIAPSPTGENLHIGNVYAALLNFAFAKKHNGSFIIRIEDTDRVRLVKGSEERIIESLNWLGITHNEGPDIGGPYAPYRQSDRKDIYKKFALELVEKNAAYYCFCTTSRLEEMRKAQKEKKEPMIYDGFCKKYSLKEAKELVKTEQYVIRLNVPDSGATEFSDLLRGNIAFENSLLDDQVLLKSDGFPTYHLGVVVDDHIMKISHIIRAEEWISSTPKHILLYKFFEWDLPIFAHIPILRNTDKSKLSKRKNPVWVSWYREQGFLQEAILNYLALMGWSHPEEKEIFSLTEFIENFSLEDIKPVGPVFDIEKLKWMNGEYIRMMENSVLLEKLRLFYKSDTDIVNYFKENEKDLLEIIVLVKSRIKTLSEFKELVIPLFLELSVDEKNVAKSIFELFEKMQIWDKDAILLSMKKILKEKNIKGSILYKIFTGREKGLPLPESLVVLGKEKTLERLSRNF